MKFKVGDRVVGKGIVDGLDITRQKGTIAKIDWLYHFASVNFDDDFSDRLYSHPVENCINSWVVRMDSLELIDTPVKLEPDEQKPERYIIERTENTFLVERIDDFQGLPRYREVELNRDVCALKGDCKDHVGNTSSHCTPANCGKYKIWYLKKIKGVVYEV